MTFRGVDKPTPASREQMVVEVSESGLIYNQSSVALPKAEMVQTGTTTEADPETGEDIEVPIIEATGDVVGRVSYFGGSDDDLAAVADSVEAD